MRGLGFLEGFEGFVRRVIGCFNAVGLDYMFTGVLAASFYGVPRTTVDVDVVEAQYAFSYMKGLLETVTSMVNYTFLYLFQVPSRHLHKRKGVH